MGSLWPAGAVHPPLNVVRNLKRGLDVRQVLKTFGVQNTDQPERIGEGIEPLIELAFQ